MSWICTSHPPAKASNSQWDSILKDIREESRLREEWPRIREKRAQTHQEFPRETKFSDVIWLVLSANWVLSAGGKINPTETLNTVEKNNVKLSLQKCFSFWKSWLATNGLCQVINQVLGFFNAQHPLIYDAITSPRLISDSVIHLPP